MDNVVSPKGFPPALNEDAAYILSDLLGMDAGQIEALTQSGALLAQKP
jgi:crotonobetainyl-CoA:carnitine CoA-transferase CaiB-like acyl-CoA transferase